MTGPKEIKGASHAAAEAVVVKDEGEEAWKGYGARVKAGEVGKRVEGS